MQLRREISDKATFYSGRGQWLHALLRAISNNREFVYYSCFPCNRCRFFIRVYEKIHHFHTDHNAAWIHPKFCISVVFDFSWDDCSTLEKLETMVKQYIFFLGGGGDNVHHGLCENGEWLNTAGYLTICCFCFVNRFSEQISYSQHLFIFSSSGPDHRIHLHYSEKDKTKHKIVKQVLDKRLSIQFNLINYVSQSQQTKTIR